MLCSICRPSRRFLKTSSWYTLITCRRIGRRFWKHPRGFSVFFQQESCSPTLRYNYLSLFFFFDFVFSKGFLENIHIAVNPLKDTLGEVSRHLVAVSCLSELVNVDSSYKMLNLFIYLLIYFEHVWNGVKVQYSIVNVIKYFEKEQNEVNTVIPTPCFSWVA